MERFQLPAVINPSDSVCVQIQVPNDPAHFDAFWSAIYELGQAFNWVDDGTGANQQCAEVWDAIWSNLHNGNCPVFTLIRESPTDSNLYQFSNNNGATWTDLCVKPAFTMRLLVKAGVTNQIQTTTNQEAVGLDMTAAPPGAQNALVTFSPA